MKHLEDSPERLRECLVAMSEHTGVHAVRVQFDIRRDGGSRMIITHSGGSAEEERFCTFLAAALHALHGVTGVSSGVKQDDDGFSVPEEKSP